MSYILDALKKSEKEHQRRKRPTLSVEPALEAGRPRRQPRGRYWVALALFLNACLLVWWLRPWQAGEVPVKAREPASPQGIENAGSPATKGSPPREAVSREATPPTAPAPVQETKSVADAAPEKPAETVQLAQQSPAPVVREPEPLPMDVPPVTVKAAENTAKPIQTQPAPEIAKPPADPKTRSADAAKTKQPPQKPAKMADAGKKPAEALGQKGMGGSKELVLDLKGLTGAGASEDKAAVSPKALRYHELPSRVRDAMPRIAVSMLLYSKKPDERWINVNGAKMREGQEVSSGLKVEQITPDGAVFNFQGQRFYKAVIGD